MFSANSAIFTTMSANGYRWAVVSEQFVLDQQGRQPIVSTTVMPAEELKSFRDVQSSVSGYARLSNQRCVETYSNVYQNEYRTVLVVTPNIRNDESFRNVSQIFSHGLSHAADNANSWICGQQEQQAANTTSQQRCDIILKNALSVLDIGNFSDWKIFERTVLFCLSEPQETPCSIQYSGVIVGLLIIFTFTTLASMATILILAWKSKNKPLVCPGDAAESFLRDEDPTTMGMCLASWMNVRKLWKSPSSGKMFKAPQYRVWKGTGPYKWLCLTLM